MLNSKAGDVKLKKDSPFKDTALSSGALKTSPIHLSHRGEVDVVRQRLCLSVSLLD